LKRNVYMSKEFKIGAISVIIIALFIWGYNFLKGEDLLNPSKREFYIEYSNIQGLKVASPVTINGLEVGRVTKISFDKNPEKKGNIIVEIALNTDFEFSKNSIAKIYPASLMGGQNIAIIPSYEGEPAVSGDRLKGVVEEDMISSVTKRLNPLQAKVESIIVRADSLLLGINQVLNEKSRVSIRNTITSLEATVIKMNKLLTNVNKIVDSSAVSVDESLKNTQKITKNFAEISETLADAKLGETIAKVKVTLENVNSLLADMEAGKGTLGKLMKDDTMYINLTNASKEMEELLREMKLHPKRFVHFSLFGKKAKPYQKEEPKK